MRFLLAAFLIAGCSRCTPAPAPDAPPLPPPTPPAPSEPTDACGAACERWETWGCKEGHQVCSDFDPIGNCRSFISCKNACEETPYAYASKCVAEFDISTLPKGVEICTFIRDVCNG